MSGRRVADEEPGWKEGDKYEQSGVRSHLGTQVGMFRWEPLVMGALRAHRTSGAG